MKGLSPEELMEQIAQSTDSVLYLVEMRKQIKFWTEIFMKTSAKGDYYYMHMAAERLEAYGELLKNIAGECKADIERFL